MHGKYLGMEIITKLDAEIYVKNDKVLCKVMNSKRFSLEC